MSGCIAAKDKNMALFLKHFMNFLSNFKKFKILQIPHAENNSADALSKLTSNKDSELLRVVPIEYFLPRLNMR